MPGRVGMGGVIPSPEVKGFQAEPLQERSTDRYLLWRAKYKTKINTDLRNPRNNLT